MPLTTTGRNKLFDSGKAAFTHFGCFTDVGTTEVSGGSYARQAITWAAAGSGVVATSAQLSVPIPAGTTVVTVGDWDASTAGNILGYAGYHSTTPPKGIATVLASTDTFTRYAHGLTTDDRIFFWAVEGGALPTGLSAATLYFVRATGLTADAFTIATTSGGAAVDITASGEAAYQKTVPNTFASAGNLVVATSNHTLDGTFA
jgi:hypothetical protein